MYNFEWSFNFYANCHPDSQQWQGPPPPQVPLPIYYPPMDHAQVPPPAFSQSPVGTPAADIVYVPNYYPPSFDGAFEGRFESQSPVGSEGRSSSSFQEGWVDIPGEQGMGYDYAPVLDVPYYQEGSGAITTPSGCPCLHCAGVERSFSPLDEPFYGGSVDLCRGDALFPVPTPFLPPSPDAFVPTPVNPYWHDANINTHHTIHRKSLDSALDMVEKVTTAIYNRFYEEAIVPYKFTADPIAGSSKSVRSIALAVRPQSPPCQLVQRDVVNQEAEMVIREGKTGKRKWDDVDDAPDALSPNTEPVRETKRGRFATPPKENARVGPGSALSSAAGSVRQRETAASTPPRSPSDEAPRTETNAPAPVVIEEVPIAVPTKPHRFRPVCTSNPTKPTDTTTKFGWSGERSIPIIGGHGECIGECKVFTLAGQKR